MDNHLYWDDIEEGQELPSLVKFPTTQLLMKWAGATGDFSQIHYDKDFAQGRGLPGVIVHGWLSFSFVVQVITSWLGAEGELRKIGVKYKGMNFPGKYMKCGAKVARKYFRDGEYFIDLDIWANNPEGQTTTAGNATLVLPAREQ